MRLSQDTPLIAAGWLAPNYAWFIALANDDHEYWYGTVDGSRPDDDADPFDIYMYETEYIGYGGYDSIEEMDSIFAS